MTLRKARVLLSSAQIIVLNELTEGLDEAAEHDRTNITNEELEGLQTIATDLLARTEKQLNEAVESGVLQEICQ